MVVQCARVLCYLQIGIELCREVVDKDLQGKMWKIVGCKKQSSCLQTAAASEGMPRFRKARARRLLERVPRSFAARLEINAVVRRRVEEATLGGARHRAGPGRAEERLDASVDLEPRGRRGLRAGLRLARRRRRAGRAVRLGGGQQARIDCAGGANGRTQGVSERKDARAEGSLDGWRAARREEVDWAGCGAAHLQPAARTAVRTSLRAC